MAKQDRVHTIARGIDAMMKLFVQIKKPSLDDMKVLSHYITKLCQIDVNRLGGLGAIPSILVGYASVFQHRQEQYLVDAHHADYERKGTDGRFSSPASGGIDGKSATMVIIDDKPQHVLASRVAPSPTPWKYTDIDNGLTLYREVDGEQQPLATFLDARHAFGGNADPTFEQAQANLKRTCDCVNAFEGVEVGGSVIQLIHGCRSICQEIDTFPLGSGKLRALIADLRTIHLPMFYTEHANRYRDH